jgi:multicomponent Na+:H+ antiporter subunit D
MIEQLPALQVVLPLLAAPLCMLLPARAAWALFQLVCLSTLACALALLAQVSDGGTLSYTMGGWAPPFGIEYVIDAANAFVLLLVSLAATVTALYARRSLENDLEPRQLPLCYASLCLYLCGLLGITATGDVFNVFVFLEISSLASYTLVALGRRRQALRAAFQYLILGTIGGTFLLVGIGLMYGLTGTLNMADLAARLPELHGNRALTAAIAFISVGLAIKMALFPLHAWLPGAYAEAPAAVSLFLAAAGTKVAIYVFLRFAFSVFGAELTFEKLPLDAIALILGSAGMLAGAAVACFQQDLRRMLAWSSVGQLGYIVVGFALATASGLTAAYLHLFNHALTKAALFGAAGIVLLRLGSTSLESLAGLGRRMPWTFSAMVLAGLGLIGVPLTAGFVSKWALVQALFAQEQWVVVVAVVASSLLALVYVGRVVEVAWFREPAAETVSAPPATMAVAVWLLVLITLYLGLDSAWLGGQAQLAAGALLGAGR